MKQKKRSEQYWCSFCKNEQLEYLFESRDYMTGVMFYIYKCTRCAISFTKPTLSAEQIKTFYGATYYGRRKSFSEALMNKARVKKILRLCGNGDGKKILDIGCGNGSFLSLLQNYGWTIYGTEISPESHLVTEEIASMVCRQDLLDCRFPDKMFDAITLWHSLEHMQHSQRYLSNANKILKDNGLLVVEVPNFQSWQSQLTKGDWFHLDVPRHISHYNPRNITALLHSCGFSVLKISHTSFIYGIFGFTQSIINVFTKRNNILFDYMNGKVKLGNLKHHNIELEDVLITFILLTPVLLVCAVPLFFLESLSGNGGIITIYAKKIT